MRQTLRETMRIARERHALPMMLTCAAIIIGGLATAGYLLGNQTSDNTDVVAAIQRERVRNTQVACEQTNREHLALRGFIASSIPPDRLDDPRVKKYLALAATTFPTVNCAAEVKRRVPSGTP